MMSRQRGGGWARVVAPDLLRGPTLPTLGFDFWGLDDGKIFQCESCLLWSQGFPLWEPPVPRHLACLHMDSEVSPVSILGVSDTRLCPGPAWLATAWCSVLLGEASDPADGASIMRGLGSMNLHASPALGVGGRSKFLLARD